MNISRRNFIEGVAAGAALVTISGYGANVRKAEPYGKIALQLSSVGEYVRNFGMEKTLADVAAIGFKGVELNACRSYTAIDPVKMKKMLDDNGLVACGLTVVRRDDFSPERYAQLCEFNRKLGNTLVCATRAYPPPSDKTKVEDFMKELCDYYSEAAQNCAKYGCKVGLLNNTWEFKTIMPDGYTTYWDYFFSHTDKAVQMVQDVGSTMNAGYDPRESFKKFPGRSFSLRAKENGSADSILGQVSSAPVVWDDLIPATEADGVQWYVVECTRHTQVLSVVKQSFDFLRSKLQRR